MGYTSNYYECDVCGSKYGKVVQSTYHLCETCSDEQLKLAHQHGFTKLVDYNKYLTQPKEKKVMITRRGQIVLIVIGTSLMLVPFIFDLMPKGDQYGNLNYIDYIPPVLFFVLGLGFMFLLDSMTEKALKHRNRMYESAQRSQKEQHIKNLGVMRSFKNEQPK